ncbi:DUF3237 domain-containing protein [Alteraurantiacibacter buctensis]|uniref:DUF3237 family protein n=1 Tax=Alteraurantiacibacter buctensis TaxID=1503981 RepID=A0A844YYJ8_9SPHN|nr:DUF3237 domain-containing protein [Alteraurantiacibacter buctensis]MXO71544.1 DUF3237 family protein [Alteraurantiacibacter buctensis]
MLKRLFVAAVLAATTMSAPVAAQDAPRPPATEPGLELLYRSVVKLGPAIDAGVTALGQRRIIPIIGGTFEGPDMRGEILPMGWDWQLDRSDGCTQIIADYFLRTDDGVIINVVNTGALCRPGTDGAAPPPVRTSPVFEAPRGRYEGLSQGGHIGTLGFDPSVQEPHVVITIYRSN